MTGRWRTAAECYLDPFSVNNCRIHFQNGGFYGSRRWKLRHADVDRIGPLRVQNNELFVLARFLLPLALGKACVSFKFLV